MVKSKRRDRTKTNTITKNIIKSSSIKSLNKHRDAAYIRKGINTWHQGRYKNDPITGKSRHKYNAYARHFRFKQVIK